MKIHDSDSYQIVIVSRYLSQAANDLYNAASRGESIAYDLLELNGQLAETTRLIDKLNTSKGQ
jgi:hypothetical protein